MEGWSGGARGEGEGGRGRTEREGEEGWTGGGRGAGGGYRQRCSEMWFVSGGRCAACLVYVFVGGPEVCVRACVCMRMRVPIPKSLV